MENVGVYIEKSVENYFKNIDSKQNLDSNVDILSLFKELLNTFNLSADKLKDFTSILSKISLVLIAILIICIILYFLKAIGMYVISRKRNISLSYLSFVPFGFFYILGKVTGKTSIYKIEIDKPEFLLPILLLSAVILPCLSMISLILFILAFYGLLYRLYEKLTYSFRIPLLLLSIILPFLIPVFIFLIRNKE